MTLHFTRTSEQYTLQASDRLVSGSVHDPLANKNLIYRARDAIVSIGYTGLAYELSSSDRNMPTDEWIAEKLWGKLIPRGPDGVEPVTFAIERICRWLDIGQSIELLRRELQKSVDRLPSDRREYSFELIVVGWQEKRRRGFKPIMAHIVKPKGSAPVAIKRPQRNWHLGGRIALIDTPSGWVSSVELADLGNNLRTASPDESEHLLVESIRRVASQNPQRVGPHCMTVLLPPVGVAPIRVRFIANVSHTAVFTSQSQNIARELPVAFSPWIIGPNMFNAPSLIVGSWHVQMGPFEIVIDAPASEKGITGYMGALHRPSCP